MSQTNPTEFKKITSQIASQLQQAAKSATDPNQANALQQLATNFQTASQSGKFSDLFPQSSNSSTGSDAAGRASSAGGHHHHHYGSSEASTGSSNQSTSDPVSSIFANALTQIQTDLA